MRSRTSIASVVKICIELLSLFTDCAAATPEIEQTGARFLSVEYVSCAASASCAIFVFLAGLDEQLLGSETSHEQRRFPKRSWRVVCDCDASAPTTMIDLTVKTLDSQNHVFSVEDDVSLPLSVSSLF